MIHPELLKQQFQKRGCRERSVPAGVRGVPEQLFFPFFARRLRRRERRERSVGDTPNPSKGLAALCNPASLAA